MYDIIIGRNQADLEKFGDKGVILLGKHYIKMGRTTSLSNNVYLDVARSHIVFVCGKRGGGKSYTMGVIAEGMADLPREIKQNLSFILLDTMGIYWTMKYPNHKDKELLDQWNLKSKGLDVKIYTPKGYYDDFKEKGIPTDFPFSIKPSELNAEDWCMTFNIDRNDPVGVLIEGTIHKIKQRQQEFDVDEVIEELKRDNETEKEVVNAAVNRFLNCKNWGIFDKKGTPLNELAKGGQVTVLDVSCYATMPGGWEIKALVIGLIAQKLFLQRMVARRNEEYEDVHQAVHYFADEDKPKKQEFPLVWLVIDEAHEFLPNKGKTMATDPLVTILREGRQPGISLILASQQPGKIHTDVMTQSDTIISHRITAKLDTDALGMLMQSYMREGLDKFLNELPRVKGAAIILDDNNEKMYPIRVRPRFTWHGGEAPMAVNKEKKVFDFE
ncbi:ATP-binding protein [Candidatus Woesearchaeota archaeon]|nr:ATP-binding protein [Candidatus Woesearchaeota archaeon]